MHDLKSMTGDGDGDGGGVEEMRMGSADVAGKVLLFCMGARFRRIEFLG